MEIERHRGVIANAHIKIGSNSYEKVELEEIGIHAGNWVDSAQDREPTYLKVFAFS